MFSKVVSSLSLLAILSPSLIANPIDISYNDEEVPASGTFKLIRKPRTPLNELSVRKQHRKYIGSEIEFTLGEKSSLTFLIDDKMSFHESTDKVKFPQLQFSEDFLKEILHQDTTNKRSSKWLRKTILNSPMSQLLDETSRNTLYAFIFDQLNNYRKHMEKISLERLKERLPEDLPLKFFLYPPHKLFSVIDPVEKEYELYSNADPKIRQEAMQDLLKGEDKTKGRIVEYSIEGGKVYRQIGDKKKVVPAKVY